MNKFFVLLCVLVLHSCMGTYYTENHGLRTTKPRFQLADENYKLNSNDVINTKAIYMCPNCGKWFRFFSNGKVIYSSMFYNEQTINPNDLRRGYVGYFALENDTTIKINLLYATQGAYYIMLTGTIKNGVIKFNEFDNVFFGNAVLKDHFRYRYIKTLPSDIPGYDKDSLEGHPDW